VRRGIAAGAAATVLQVAIAVHALLLLLGQNLVVRHGYDRPCLRLIKSTNSLVNAKSISNTYTRTSQTTIREHNRYVVSLIFIANTFQLYVLFDGLFLFLTIAG
jgi:hypothetical protein